MQATVTAYDTVNTDKRFNFKSGFLGVLDGLLESGSPAIRSSSTWVQVP